MRWISFAVAAALVLAGACAARPALAAARSPETQLTDAKALVGKLGPRRSGQPAPEQRRSSGPPLVLVPTPADLPPRVALHGRSVSRPVALHTAPLRSPRTSRGPPG